MKTREMPKLLDPSPLGTEEYWEELYNTDISTHMQTPSHVGQVWFDESGAEDRTISFLERSDLGLDQETATILDLGTGNASMLMRLREEGWEGDLWGLDYSLGSVRLARQLVREWHNRREYGERLEDLREGSEGEHESATVDAPDAENPDVDKCLSPAPGIYITKHDILKVWPPIATDTESAMPRSFDLVHDKGTFDAISLSKDANQSCPTYCAVVQGLVKPGGLLLITSCNWTESELEEWISGNGSQFTKVGRIGYSQFKFGGQEGGVLSGLCWRRSTQ